jgi:hypothetical protein
MAEFLTSRTQYLRAVALETAKMSFPGRMNLVVKAGTKNAVAEYFVTGFPMRDVWENARQTAKTFDRWHEKRVRELGNHIQNRRLVKKKSDRAVALAAKFFNTFMHQLMKYEPCRPLWDHLHLPLDRRILAALGKLKRSVGSLALEEVTEILRNPPYVMSYAEYLQVQHALRNLLTELNRRPGSEVKLKSRIELNLLWA